MVFRTQDWLNEISPSGEELGKEAEEVVDAAEQQRRLVEYEDACASSGNASSSTSVAPQAAGQQAGAALSKVKGSTDPAASQQASAEPVAHSKRRDAGFKREPYGERKKWKDSGTQDTGETPSNWSGFDLSRVLRVLRNADLPSCRLTLRKLHLRWWHAPAAAMTKLLERAGVSKEVCALVPEIVDTCEACRTWAKPQPASQAHVELVDRFNAQVETDLLFVYDYIVMHFVDKCTRWHHAIIVPDKTAPELIKGIDSWYSIHGPMTELVTDGESAIAKANETDAYCKQKGIKLKVRAPAQQIPVIDRRGALLRDNLHRVTTQCELEGLDIPFSQRLSECVFAGNALTSINNCTPYNAVYGRSPALLPALEVINEEGEISPITDRMVNRVREIAIQAMIEGTAHRRLLQALNTRTLPPGEAQELKPGDSVEYYRPTGNKDVSGWKGDAEVQSIGFIKDGIIKIKHGRNIMSCRAGDVRRSLDYLVFLTRENHPGWSVNSAWRHIKQYVERLDTGESLTLGHVWTKGRWQLTKCSSEHVQLYEACKLFAESGLYREHVCSIRLGKGVARLSGTQHCDSSHLLWWGEAGTGKVDHLEIEIQNGDCPQLASRGWSQTTGNRPDSYKLSNMLSSLVLRQKGIRQPVNRLAPVTLTEIFILLPFLRLVVLCLLSAKKPVMIAWTLTW